MIAAHLAKAILTGLLFFETIKTTGYRGNVSIEAFGRRQPDLAAATKIWRTMFASEEQLAADGLAFLRKELIKETRKVEQTI